MDSAKVHKELHTSHLPSEIFHGQEICLHPEQGIVLQHPVFQKDCPHLVQTKRRVGVKSSLRQMSHRMSDGVENPGHQAPLVLPRGSVSVHGAVFRLVEARRYVVSASLDLDQASSVPEFHPGACGRQSDGPY
ncbi:Heat shock transcription factor, X-linked [Manis javanica]|nr:Heat shock transcription factor, X-linked [Manis javanica]